MKHITRILIFSAFFYFQSSAQHHAVGIQTEYKNLAWKNYDTNGLNYPFSSDYVDLPRFHLGISYTKRLKSVEHYFQSNIPFNKRYVYNRVVQTETPEGQIPITYTGDQSIFNWNVYYALSKSIQINKIRLSAGVSLNPNYTRYNYENTEATPVQYANDNFGPDLLYQRFSLFTGLRFTTEYNLSSRWSIQFYTVLNAAEFYATKSDVEDGRTIILTTTILDNQGNTTTRTFGSTSYQAQWDFRPSLGISLQYHFLKKA